MANEQPLYLSYLLRCWRVNAAGRPRHKEPGVWRASLEDPITRQRVGFASLDALFEFLRGQTGGNSPLSESALDGKR